MRILFFICAVCFALFVHSSNDPSSDELLAAQYFSQGQYEKAVVLYAELFEKNPTPIIYNNYLRSLLELQEFRQAERLVNRQIRDNPGRVRFEVDLGYVHLRAANERRARRQLQGLINDLTAHPAAVRELANAFLFRNMHDYALEAYMQGRKMLGDAHPFHLQIASIYDHKAEYEKMMQEYIGLLVIDESKMEEVQGLLQDAIQNDPEFLKSDALRRVLLRGTQANPEITLYSEMLMWLSLQQKDFTMAFRQARALDRRLRQDGELVMEVARLSAANNSFEIARQGFEYILAKGDLNPHYYDARIGLLDVQYRQATSGYEIDYDLLRVVEEQYEKAIEQMGLNRQSVTLVRNLAHLKAFYLDNTRQATELLRSVIDIPNISNRIRGECRIELANILLLQGELWDAHLLYAQVDKSFRDDPLAHEARFKNARLSFYMGEFKWSKAQLDILKAATSRLIANDAMALSLLIQDNLESDGTSVPLQMFARAELHTFRNHFDNALTVLDSVRQLFPSHRILDNVMMAEARIYMRTGKYHMADSTLAAITQQYPAGLLAADALFQRGLLQERVFEDKEKAKSLYQQLIVKYPGSLNTMTARNRFRYLRGDDDVQLMIQEQFFYYGL